MKARRRHWRIRRMEIDRRVRQSTLDNKVQDAIGAVRLLEKQNGVDPSQIFLRGVVARDARRRCRVSNSVRSERARASSVMGSTCATTSSMMSQTTEAVFANLAANLDANGDGTISGAEYSRRERLPKSQPAQHDVRGP